MPRVNQKEFVGSLPLWTSEPVMLNSEDEDKPDGLALTCPRRDCGHEHIVLEKPWREASDRVGRVCPYCSKISRLPEE